MSKVGERMGPRRVDDAASRVAWAGRNGVEVGIESLKVPGDQVHVVHVIHT